MAFRITSGPAAEPISRTEAKLHCRIDGAADDTLVDGMIRAARTWVEIFTNRQLVTATLELKQENLPYELVLPRPPLQSISSVTYVDLDDATQTADSDLYATDVVSEPGRLYMAYNETWPTCRGYTQDVTITWKAGYASVITANATTNVFTCSARTYVDADIVRVWNTGGALPAGLSVNTDYHVRDVTGSTFNLAATAGGEAIDITTAGTGTNFVGEIPEPMRLAIKLILGHMYEHREDVADVVLREVPMAAQALLWPYRIWYEED